MNNEYTSNSITSVIDASVSKTGPLFAPPWIRLCARLFATSLDDKLAGGRDPLSSQLLSARSQQLVAAHYRRGIADSWLDLLIDVRRPFLALNPAVPLVRTSVLEAEEEIRSLAEALVVPLPTVRGVAKSVTLLRDGAGPLYNRYGRPKLTDAVEEIIAMLDPLATTTTL
jgi:hypothetical protein